MKKMQLLSTVAAALLLSAGVATAQVVKQDEAPGRAPAAQRNAPAEKMGPSLKAGERKAHETTGQATPKEPELNKNLNAQSGAKGGELKGNSELKGSVKGNAELKGKDEHSLKGNAQIKGKEEHNAQTNKSITQEKRSTTGQGAAAGAARLTTEQRTKITTIFHQHRVEPARLNISIHVGARVPETVHFYPVPVQVVEVYPEWRGYDYILVGDQILIVDPGTHEIVAILEA